MRGGFRRRDSLLGLGARGWTSRIRLVSALSARVIVSTSEVACTRAVKTEVARSVGEDGESAESDDLLGSAKTDVRVAYVRQDLADNPKFKAACAEVERAAHRIPQARSLLRPGESDDVGTGWIPGGLFKKKLRGQEETRPQVHQTKQDRPSSRARLMVSWLARPDVRPKMPAIKLASCDACLVRPELD